MMSRRHGVLKLASRLASASIPTRAEASMGGLLQLKFAIGLELTNSAAIFSRVQHAPRNRAPAVAL